MRSRAAAALCGLALLVLINIHSVHATRSILLRSPPRLRGESNSTTSAPASIGGVSGSGVVPRVTGPNDRLDFVTDEGLRVEFTGKSPHFRFYPDAAVNETYLWVKFSKVEELTADGKGVNGHKISSLAATDATYAWGTEEVSGVNVTFVTVSIGRFALGNSWRDDCSGVPALANSTNMVITVKAMFGFGQNLTVPYGYNNTLGVLANSMKFNIEASDFPFCNVTNRLSIQLKLGINVGQVEKPYWVAGRAEDGTTETVVPVTRSLAAELEFPDYAFDAVNGTNLINVTAVVAPPQPPPPPPPSPPPPLANGTANSTAALTNTTTVDAGEVVIVELGFDYFPKTLYYDPAIHTVSAPPPPPSSDGSVGSSGAIAGIVAGIVGTAVLMVAVAGVALRMRANSKAQAVHPDPAALGALPAPPAIALASIALASSFTGIHPPPFHRMSSHGMIDPSGRGDGLVGISHVHERPLAMPADVVNV